MGAGEEQVITNETGPGGITRQKGQDTMKITIEAIATIINEAETMKNAYFFTPPMTARDRRSYEKKHSHDLVEWEEGGHTYTAQYTVVCSCKCVYASGKYTKDGNKTTLLAIRNSYKRLVAKNA